MEYAQMENALDDLFSEWDGPQGNKRFSPETRGLDSMETHAFLHAAESRMILPALSHNLCSDAFFFPCGWSCSVAQSSKDDAGSFTEEADPGQIVPLSPSKLPGSSGSTIPGEGMVQSMGNLEESSAKSLDRKGTKKRATPRKILKLMNSDGLMVYKAKSHSQKYHISKDAPESAPGNKVFLNGLQKHNTEAEVGVLVTLRLQLELQTHLQKQLQDLCDLQTELEEHGKCLKRMLKRQKEATKSLLVDQLSLSHRSTAKNLV